MLNESLINSKHKIIVAGIGPGSVNYISPAAIEAIKSAKILVAGRRALSTFADKTQITFPITGDLNSAINFIREKILINDIVVMVSGDPGYYSMLDVLRREFPIDIIKVIPSISSIQLAFARLSLSWYSAILLSFHGRRPDNSALKYEDGKIIGMLTDTKYDSHTIPPILIENGWRKDSRLAICSRLSYNDEKITLTTLEGAKSIEVVKNCILIAGF